MLLIYKFVCFKKPFLLGKKNGKTLKEFFSDLKNVDNIFLTYFYYY